MEVWTPGQHNTQQRIQHHMKVKEENVGLRADVAKLHDDLARQTSRCGVLPHLSSVFSCDPSDS